MTKFTDLLIDIDGTLLDTHEVERVALLTVLNEHGINMTDEMLKQYSKINESLWIDFEKGLISKSDLRIKRFEIFLSDRFNIDAKSCAKRYFELYSTTVIPFENVTQTLKLLTKKYRLHIVSNGSTDVQYYKLNKLSITSLFDNIFLSEEIGFAKPDVRFFKHVQNKLQQDKLDKIMIIGDSFTADIKSAKEFGYTTAWVTDNQSDYADYIIKSFNDIKNILL